MPKPLFLDESGSHNLSVVDPNYPVFVLGGVLMDQRYAEGELKERLCAFKKDVFGNEDLILHTADMTRNRNGFERMQEAAFRARCYERLNHLMTDLEYKVIACVIKKGGHLSRYGVSALDPYMFSLEILVERFALEIGDQPHGGEIIAECRGPELDRQPALAWENLRVQGSRYVTATKIRDRIGGVTSSPKTANIAGLQMADLIVSPIGRFVLGKPVRKDFRIVESKFRCDARGNYRGRGLVVLPKE